MNKTFLLFTAIVLLLFLGCSENKEPNLIETDFVALEAINRVSTSFQILDPKSTGIDADNIVTPTENFNYFLWASFYMGSGVGIADFNNDGLPDVYMGQNMTQDKLYINKGNMKFDDISDTSLPKNLQWTTGVSVVDINNDGWMDIYVCSFGPSMNPKDRKNRLLVNQKNNTFVNEAAKYGVDDGGFTIMATFFDMDKDGDKDLYIVNQPLDVKLAQINGVNPADKRYDFSDKFLIRDSNGKYVDKSKQYGIENLAYGLNVLVDDVNEDGWLDLYITNDYEKPDYLYINQEGKGFKNELEGRVGHISNFSMGSDVADINNDGLNDILTLDMSSSDHYKSKTNMNAMDEKAFWENVGKGNYYQYMFNALHLNQGEGQYSEIAQMSGVAQTDWSWSVILEDFNMDGLKDAYVTNGIAKDVRNNDFTKSLESKIRQGQRNFKTLDLVNQLPSNPISNYYYENKGDLTFEDRTKASAAFDADFSTGCAVADLDRDGDLDIVASVSEGPSKILQNNTSHTSKLLVYSLDAGLWNEFLNSKFIVETNCGVQRRDVVPTRGYNSSSWDQIIFAVPNECSILRGYVTTIYGDIYELNIQADGEVNKITKAGLKSIKLPGRNNKSQYFSNSSSIDYTHQENDFNDYKIEVLLPHKLSENGPCTAVADVDGDGNKDLFIGGSKGYPMHQFQKKSNKWVSINSTNWEQWKGSENRSMTFFDADGDGDQDLYIANGGNESITNGNSWLVDQLMINDGKGNFTINKTLPKIGKNTSKAIVKDIDTDGDMDLVVFASHRIGSYPESFSSYILENNEGKFKITKDLDVGLEEIGLVSDAVEIDYNNDGKMDILTVGEWSIPHVLISDGKKLKLDSPAELENLSSWWNTVSTGDFNNDGRPDLVIGSFGENNKFHPSDKKPLEIFGRDFDGSGTNDVVLAKHYNDKVVPTRGRECSSQQIPNIKDKFPTFNEFALAGIDDILGSENLEKSIHKKITGMSHLVLWNLPSGWSSEKLPTYCQISPIKSIAVLDVNEDGIDDMIGIGNHYGAEVETARYDAGYGWVLLGNKDQKLTYKSAYESGLYHRGDGRSLSVIEEGSNTEVIAFYNNDKAISYKLK
jgi:hypothetical protein